MFYTMFLDDERIPVLMSNAKVICRSYDEAVAYVNGMGRAPNWIDFDHDLGEGKNGYDFAKFLIERDIDQPGFIPKEFGFAVHSQNPIGARNIRNILDSYLEQR